MSIYSGFATRQQQSQYYSYVQMLLINLQKRVLKFYRKQNIDEFKFFTNTKKIIISLQRMEKFKYLQPKLSETMKQLLQFLTTDQYRQIFTNLEQQQKQESTNLTIISTINQNQNNSNILNKKYPILAPATLSKSKNILSQYQKDYQRRNSQTYRSSLQTRQSNKIMPDQYAKMDFKVELPLQRNYQQMAALALQKFMNPQKCIPNNQKNRFHRRQIPTIQNNVSANINKSMNQTVRSQMQTTLRSQFSTNFNINKSVQQQQAQYEAQT